MSFDLRIRNGDIAIAADGQVESVSDNAKLKQDIIKILLTKLGENRFHPKYGSDVGSLTIGHVPDQELLEIDLKSSTEKSISNLIALQRSQSRRQFLSAGEKIVSILGINVERDRIDPRLYNIFISVQTGQLTNLTESITVRLI